MANIKSISGKNSTWTAIIQPTAKDLQFLKKKFKFADEDIRDSLPSRHAQHPHITLRSNYVFIEALFPIYLKEKRLLQSTEVDMFLDRNHLFTIHTKHVPVIHNLFDSLQQNKSLRDEYLNDSPLIMLHEILSKLFHSLHPMLEHIHRDIKNIERSLFANKEFEMVQEILIIKTNILNFKRTMQAHNWVIKKVLDNGLNIGNADNNVQFMYDRLLEQLHDISSLIETYAQTIESLERTNNTKLAIKTNEDIRRLTVLTVYIFIIGVFTGIFGMGAKATPIMGSRYDFWILITLMVIAIGFLYRYFKKKGLI